MTLRWSLREFSTYTAEQRVLFRAVAGAVMNCAHGHPDWGLTKIKARSIAKRAAGTLASLRRGTVLAAPTTPSETTEAALPRQSPSVSRVCQKAPGTRGATPASGLAKGPTRRSPSPFRIAHGAIGILAGEAKRAGQAERHAALADALRVLAAVRRQNEAR